jgi:hypothetical protein
VRRALRWGLLCACALLAQACGPTRLLYSKAAFLYSNAAPALAWSVDDYVDLTDAQKEMVRARLDRVAAWHRREALPELSRLLGDFGGQVAAGLTEGALREDQERLRRQYQQLVEKAIPDAAELVASFDAAQVSQLERKFATEDRKLSREIREEPQERREKQAARLMDHIEAWTGSLSDDQRALVARHLEAMPDLAAARLADRKRREAEFIALLRAQPDRDAIVAGLRRAFIETAKGRDAALDAALRDRDARYVRMLVELGETLTAEQRDAVKERVRGLQADIARLTNGS